MRKKVNAARDQLPSEKLRTEWECQPILSQGKEKENGDFKFHKVRTEKK